MGQTLENGVYLPSEGERNCYAGLKTNWEILDQKVADVTALQQAVAGALHREIVESLPTTDIDPNTIYMVLSGTSATENVYNEFMYVNNAWELIGTSATDLTNYYTKAEVDGKLLLKANDSDVVHKSGDEAISGIKTFSSSLKLTAYPSIRMYISDDEWNVLPQTAKQSEIRFSDKNLVTVSYFVFQHRTDSNEPFRTCWRQQKMDGTSGYYGIAFNNLGDFYPENDNTITLGGVSKRWKSVYATNYYYGSNNVEFSTKFVTTDTAQTISSAKTFEGVDLKLKSVAGEYTVSSGSTSLLFYDKNSLLLSQYKQGVYGSGLSYQVFNILGYDSNNQQVSQSITFSSGNLGLSTAFLKPDTDNAIALGRSSAKWSDVQTYKVNNLEPSSLSLPSGNASDKIDISSYITDLSGTPNSYTPPANGYLTFTFSNGSRVQIYTISGGGVSSMWVSGGSAGIIRGFMPVLKNSVLRIVINATTMESFYFIPCQGNV